MPEVWMNYGTCDVVLDIPAENLASRLDSAGGMPDEELAERIHGLDISGPVRLAILHDSEAVRRVVSSIFAACEKRSAPFPQILADRYTARSMRAGLPEGCHVDGLAADLSDGDLIFVAEAEFDGLFGYETVSTRLAREFGGDSMLEAYSARAGDMPEPGTAAGPLGVANGFVDQFEIKCIDVAAGSSGILDVAVGHPSKTAAEAAGLLSGSVLESERHGAAIISTGRQSSSDSLSASLRSLWNCLPAIKRGGSVTLVAECTRGLGSEAFQRYVEGRLAPGHLRNPKRYLGGMENLLYLLNVADRLDLSIVSILPELYTKKLGMTPLPGIRHSLQRILDVRGMRQKVAIVLDGARTMLKVPSSATLETKGGPGQ